MSVITTFVFYFLGFAFIHSLLATDHIKKIAENELKEKFRFYRIIYNILTFITAAPAFFVWITSSSSTPLLYSVPGWLFPFLILLRLLALGLLAYSAFQTDLLEFAGFRRNKTEGKLMTDKAYGIVRHPLYTAIIVMIFTKAEMTLLDLTAAVLVTIYFIAGAYIEERRLVSAFGDAYSKYRQHVSMFVPVKWVINKIKVPSGEMMR
jgi:protein-S-isoprenylcysteine O-methyltransferase Ste14